MWARCVWPSLLLALTMAVASIAARGPVPSPFSGPIRDLASPAPAGSAEPGLASDGHGQVWLSWIEAGTEGTHLFRAAALNGAAWSTPVTIAGGPQLLANWADTPSMFVTSTGTLAAHWLERGAGREAYGIRLRTSADLGRTWTSPLIPHGDDTPTQHGFVSFFEAPDAGLGLVWLDGRETTARGGGDMTLRATTLTRTGAGNEMLVDDRVCDCCQTSAARTVDGVIVAYRDRTADEVRDISVRRFSGKAWSDAETVHPDHWQINGCPVNGPAIAARGRSVAVAWFTAAGGTPRIQVAFSTDGGTSFGDPVQLTSGTTLGRLAMVMPNEGRVLVASIDRADGLGRLVVREARGSGEVSDAVVIAPTSPERTSGFPRMALSGRQVVLAWTDVTGADSRVRAAMGALR
jgi:hypothetical protein